MRRSRAHRRPRDVAVRFGSPRRNRRSRGPCARIRARVAEPAHDSRHDDVRLARISRLAVPGVACKFTMTSFPFSLFPFFFLTVSSGCRTTARSADWTPATINVSLLCFSARRNSSGGRASSQSSTWSRSRARRTATADARLDRRAPDSRCVLPRTPPSPCTRTPRFASRSRGRTRAPLTVRRNSSRAARRVLLGNPERRSGSPRYTRPGISRIRVRATQPAPCASGWARRFPACTSPRAWARLASARSTRRWGPGSRGSRWRCLCRRRCGRPCRRTRPDSRRISSASVSILRWSSASSASWNSGVPSVPPTSSRHERRSAYPMEPAMVPSRRPHEWRERFVEKLNITVCETANSRAARRGLISRESDRD